MTTRHLLAALTFSLVCLTTPATAQLCGDCNGDGMVSILDALGGAQIGAGLVTPTMAQFLACDVDADGDIDVIDALLIAQAAAGLPVTLMCAGGTPTSCTITSPSGGTRCEDIDIVFDVTSPMGTVTIDFRFSTDGGVTFTPAVAAATSPLGNPASGVAPGTGLTFTWDSASAIAAMASGVVFEVCVGTNCCTTTFDVDNPCPGVAMPQPGDLLITEVMQNPSAVSDTNGEWFEVHNLSAGTLDLDGCILSDLGTETHTISNGGPLLVAPGAAFVFGRDADPMANGNVTVDYEYASFFLGNSDDEIVIQNPMMVEVVRIEWDGGPTWPDPNGASMNLDVGVTDPMTAQSGNVWCEATMAWSGADLGSPGAVNESCGGIPPSCTASSMIADCSGSDVTLAFDTTDPDSPTITVTVRYSTDGGASFATATPAAASPAPYTVNPATATPGAMQTFVWDSASDLPGVYGLVLLEVEVDDGGASAFCSTNEFVLDNVRGLLIPTCTVTAPTTSSTVTIGAIRVEVTITDADNPAVTVLAEFSTDGGITYARATPDGTSMAPFDVNPTVATVGSDTFIWDAPGDGVMAGANVDFRFTVDDCMTTSRCSSNFNVAGTGAMPPAPGDVTITEIHADPDPAMGDANGDGMIDTSDDEFVELVNIAASDRDLSGCTLTDGFGLRHTFPPGTVIASGDALVVFGGGSPVPLSCGHRTQTASTGALGLNNGGDTITFADAMGTTLDAHSYGAEGGMNQSLVRDPEPSSMPSAPGGPFVLHSTVPAAGGRIFSVGRQAGGPCTW